MLLRNFRYGIAHNAVDEAAEEAGDELHVDVDAEVDLNLASMLLHGGSVVVGGCIWDGHIYSLKDFVF